MKITLSFVFHRSEILCDEQILPLIPRIFVVLVRGLVGCLEMRGKTSDIAVTVCVVPMKNPIHSYFIVVWNYL